MRGQRGILALSLRRAWRMSAWRYAFAVSLAAMAIPFMRGCLNFWGHDVAELPSAGVAWVGNYATMRTTTFAVYIFFLMFPLSSACYSDNLFNDVRSGRATVTVPRSGLFAYVLSGAFVTFVSAFLVVLVPLLVSQLLSFAAFPAEASEDAFLTFFNDSSSYPDLWGSSFDGIPLSGLYVSHRVLYNLLRIVYDALWAGILALTSFALSLYTRRSRFVVLCAPTLMFLACSTFLPPALRLSTYLAPPVPGIVMESMAFLVLSPIVVFCAVCMAIVWPLLRGRDVLL